MKKYKLYSYTTIIFLVLFTVLSVFSIPLLVRQFSIPLLKESYDNAKKSGKIFETLSQVDEVKESFIAITQKAIENTQNNISFLSIIDWTGNYVCYPNITKIGEEANSSNTIDFEGEITGEKLYDHFFNYFNSKKITSDTDIIDIKPIKDSDLILVYHFNINEIDLIQNKIKSYVYITFIILGLILLLMLLIVTRITNTFSSKLVEERVLNLEYSTKNLDKLNESLSLYQQRVIEQAEEVTKEQPKSEEKQISETSNKQRILTYVRNELVSILVEEIAFIYVENTITYIVRRDGKRVTSGDSLEKLYSVLDSQLFFKTNRQFIVAISAIEKITKFENNKLKIETKPKSEIDIIIGKNKASAFKQWLDL